MRQSIVSQVSHQHLYFNGSLLIRYLKSDYSAGSGWDWQCVGRASVEAPSVVMLRDKHC